MAYKKINNKCYSLNKKAKKSYFQEDTKNSIIGINFFWKTVKPFMTIKGIPTDGKIVTESENDGKIKSKGKSVLDIKAGDVVNDEEILVKMLNNDYVNIVESSTGVAPIE